MPGCKGFVCTYPYQVRTGEEKFEVCKSYYNKTTTKANVQKHVWIHIRATLGRESKFKAESDMLKIVNPYVYYMFGKKPCELARTRTHRSNKATEKKASPSHSDGSDSDSSESSSSPLFPPSNRKALSSSDPSLLAPVSYQPPPGFFGPLSSSHLPAPDSKGPAGKDAPPTGTSAPSATPGGKGGGGGSSSAQIGGSFLSRAIADSTKRASFGSGKANDSSGIPILSTILQANHLPPQMQMLFTYASLSNATSTPSPKQATQQASQRFFDVSSPLSIPSSAVAGPSSSSASSSSSLLALPSSSPSSSSSTSASAQAAGAHTPKAKRSFEEDFSLLDPFGPSTKSPRLDTSVDTLMDIENASANIAGTKAAASHSMAARHHQFAVPAQTKKTVLVPSPSSNCAASAIFPTRINGGGGSISNASAVEMNPFSTSIIWSTPRNEPHDFHGKDATLSSMMDSSSKAISSSADALQQQMDQLGANMGQFGFSSLLTPLTGNFCLGLISPLNMTPQPLLSSGSGGINGLNGFFQLAATPQPQPTQLQLTQGSDTQASSQPKESSSSSSSSSSSQSSQSSSQSQPQPRQTQAQQQHLQQQQHQQQQQQMFLHPQMCLGAVLADNGFVSLGNLGDQSPSIITGSIFSTPSTPMGQFWPLRSPLNTPQLISGFLSFPPQTPNPLLSHPHLTKSLLGGSSHPATASSSSSSSATGAATAHTPAIDAQKEQQQRLLSKEKIANLLLAAKQSEETDKHSIAATPAPGNTSSGSSSSSSSAAPMITIAEAGDTETRV